MKFWSINKHGSGELGLFALYRHEEILKKSSSPKPLVRFLSPSSPRKGGGGYGNSLCPSFCPSVIPSVRPSVPHFCLEHISKSISDINFKLHKWIDRIKEACSVQEALLYLQYFWSYCPLYIFVLEFCPEHISKSMKARNLKLHTHIELIEEAYSAQDPLFCLQYFWRYCPLYIFTLNFCPAHISKV